MRQSFIDRGLGKGGCLEFTGENLPSGMVRIFRCTCGRTGFRGADCRELTARLHGDYIGERFGRCELFLDP